MVYILLEVAKCMNDAFLVVFGCFCTWNDFSELFNDLACLEVYFDDLDDDWNMFLRSSFSEDFTLIFAG